VNVIVLTGAISQQTLASALIMCSYDAKSGSGWFGFNNVDSGSLIGRRPAKCRKRVTRRRHLVRYECLEIDTARSRIFEDGGIRFGCAKGQFVLRGGSGTLEFPLPSPCAARSSAGCEERVFFSQRFHRLLNVVRVAF
jgi:hypothetical protein